MNATTDLIAAAEQAGLSFISQSQDKLAPATRTLHRELLHAFLDTGAAPSPSWLEDQATRLGLEPHLTIRQLAEADLVHLADSSVAVAYPFSGVPTNNRVQPDGGPPIYAMCAVDALGILLMTGRDGVVSATDPKTEAPIRVVRHGSDWEWTPNSTVVLIGVTQSCSTAAESCCPHVAFYTSAEGAEAYLRTHPEIIGTVANHTEAVELADFAFGSLLGEPEGEARS